MKSGIESRDTYHIGDQTGASNLSDGVLSGLCLLLSIDDRNVGNADAEEVVAAESVSQLLYSCQYWASRSVLVSY